MCTNNLGFGVYVGLDLTASQLRGQLSIVFRSLSIIAVEL